MFVCAEVLMHLEFQEETVRLLFLFYSKYLQVEDRTKVVKTAFKMLDLDKDGFITKEEFIQVIPKINETICFE